MSKKRGTKEAQKGGPVKVGGYWYKDAETAAAISHLG